MQECEQMPDQTSICWEIHRSVFIFIASLCWYTNIEKNMNMISILQSSRSIRLRALVVWIAECAV